MNTSTTPTTDNSNGQVAAAGTQLQAGQSPPPPNALAIIRPRTVDEFLKLAKQMSESNLIPPHLRGATEAQGMANCLRVAEQAAQWGLSPYNVADQTYVVAGRLGFGGQLVAAVVQRLTGTKLKPIYNSAKDDGRAVVVYGQEKGLTPTWEAKSILKKYVMEDDASLLWDLEENGIQAVRLTVGQARTKNEIWTKDPEQKLYYSACLKWARRYVPEFVFGIASDDELGARDIGQWAATTVQPPTTTGPTESLPPGQVMLADGEVIDVEAEPQTLQEALVSEEKTAEKAEEKRRDELPGFVPEPVKTETTATQIPPTAVDAPPAKKTRKKPTPVGDLPKDMAPEPPKETPPAPTHTPPVAEVQTATSATPTPTPPALPPVSTPPVSTPSALTMEHFYRYPKDAVHQLTEEFGLIQSPPWDNDQKAAFWKSILTKYHVATRLDLSIPQAVEIRDKLIAAVRNIYKEKNITCPF